MTTISKQEFTAADTTDIATLGWTVDVGHIHVVSNTAQAQTAASWNRARFTTALDSSNHFVQAEKITGKYIYLTARQLDSSQECYAIYRTQAWGGGYYLRYVDDSGNETNIATGADDGNNLGTFKLEVDGATQEFFFEGVSKCSDDHATITIGTYIGTSGFGTVCGFDDFEGADLAGGATPPDQTQPGGDVYRRRVQHIRRH